MNGKGLLLALGVALAAIMPAKEAVAADMPLKARLITPAPPVCNLNGCTGFHVDFGVYNSGTGVNIFNLGGLTANGTSMNIGGGYQYFDGKYWLGARADIGYDLTNGGVPGLNNLNGHQMIELGGNLFGAFGLQPPQTNGFLNTITTGIPTADIGVCERGSAVGLCAGATLHYLLSNAVELDLGYLNINYGTTPTSPNSTITVDNVVWFGGRYHFNP